LIENVYNIRVWTIINPIDGDENRFNDGDVFVTCYIKLSKMTDSLEKSFQNNKSVV
jgi:hypothetical protein